MSPMANPVACLECTKPTTDGQLCPDCRGKSRERKRGYDRQRAANDPVRKLYNRAWDKLAGFLKARNPQCQRLIGGIQCQHGSYAVHHLISPTQRPDLFTTMSNLVCLCQYCHPGGTAGTPDWRPGADYVPTNTTVRIG